MNLASMALTAYLLGLFIATCTSVVFLLFKEKGKFTVEVCSMIVMIALLSWAGVAVIIIAFVSKYKDVVVIDFNKKVVK